MAVPFACALPVLMLTIGGGVDYMQAITQRERLQTVADRAAIAAAREFGMADAKKESVSAAAEEMAMTMLDAGMEPEKGQSFPHITVTTRDDPAEVEVEARQRTTPYFGATFGFVPLELTVTAVARIVGKPNICVLGLDEEAGGTISLEKQARVTANNCAVYSNSTHANSIKSKNSAVLSASLICTAGGKDGSKSNFAPDPIVDCPTFDDPLADRMEPMPAPCDASLPSSVAGSERLYPGTYCGGLEVKSGADVELAPGIYIFKDGPLRVADGGKLKGEGVGLYFVGDGAVVDFTSQSSIDLAAPEGGSMAGLLFFESRSQPVSGVHRVMSNDARNLLGTIYLPRGRLHVDAESPIADQSAYTAIIARMLTLYGGPHLVLNSNYDATSVPVPDGIRGAGQPVALVK